MNNIVLKPDFFFSPTAGFQSGAIRVSNGHVVEVGDSVDCNGAEVISLSGKFLVPGFVNAHSHAFQRALRGLVEYRTASNAHDDFWTWRTEMYRIALALSAEDLRTIARWCYLDMLRSGFVSIGEFHYLHHDLNGDPYRPTGALSHVLCDVAEELGVRLTLLETAYGRSGFQKESNENQRRFLFKDVDHFLQHAEQIRQDQRTDLIRHGLAIHSVRACPKEWVTAISETAAKERLVLHMHACEQKAEIVECQNEHGQRPLELLENCEALSPLSTVVHATHLTANDVSILQKNKAIVCICPTTERNLGDGLCPIADLQKHQIPLTIGTDSHVRIDPIAEYRAMEDHERLRLERRHILTGTEMGIGESLLRFANAGGQSLGQPAADFKIGCAADFVSFQIGPEGQANGPRVALDALMVSGSRHNVKDVFVAGQRHIADGIPIHVDHEAIEAEAIQILARLGTALSNN
jgi:formimidoylglutamate deiminase